MRVVTYGPGGYDPTRPDGNVVEVVEVPDDGLSAPTAEDRLAALVDALSKATTLSQVRAAAAAVKDA